MESELIARIYEAAAIPELWSHEVLNRLATVGDGSAAVIIASSTIGDVRWRSTPNTVDSMNAYVAENWIFHNPYLAPEKDRKFNVPRFVSDREVLSDEEMSQSPYYQGFMRPHRQLYWHCSTSIFSPSGDLLKISVHRDLEDGPLSLEALDRLTEFRPHLARAALIAARLQFERLQGGTELLNAIGLAAGALRRGRLQLANSKLEELMPSVLKDRVERVVFAGGAADARFQALLARERMGKGGSFAIEATETSPAIVAHLLPITRSANDIFSVADSMLILIPSESTLKIDVQILRALYDLTAAEAEVARAIGDGMSLEEVAKSRHASVGTVRAQLKSIFEKTGTHRQSELVRLIMGFAR